MRPRVATFVYSTLHTGDADTDPSITVLPGPLTNGQQRYEPELLVKPHICVSNPNEYRRARARCDFASCVRTEGVAPKPGQVSRLGLPDGEFSRNSVRPSASHPITQGRSPGDSLLSCFISFGVPRERRRCKGLVPPPLWLPFLWLFYLCMRFRVSCQSRICVDLVDTR